MNNWQKTLCDPVRAALLDIPETQAAAAVGADKNAFEGLYAPFNHEAAINPDNTIVVGARGVGKSFWCGALNISTLKNDIAKLFPKVGLESVEVRVGFAESASAEGFPSARTLKILSGKWDSYEIWLAIVLWNVANSKEIPALSDWGQRVQWVSEEPEASEKALALADARLFKAGKRALVCFDALDRVASSWEAIRELTKGLLRLCVDLRVRRAIRPKVFLRPDMYKDRAIWSFPDSSKLEHGRVDLIWRNEDLYGLLWNAIILDKNSGRIFKKYLKDRYGVSTVSEALKSVPKSLREDAAIQQSIFSDLAGSYMGRDRRRGKTYTWLPNHLADAFGEVSPRSFLLGIRSAASLAEHSDADTAIDADGIREGVRKASDVRLKELLEDNPWLESVFDALEGVTVPCNEEAFVQRWKDAKVINDIEDVSVSDRPKLPLQFKTNSESPFESLIDALAALGIIYRHSDGRLNMPDLFRVAAQMGRRGGVKPG